MKRSEAEPANLSTSQADDRIASVVRSLQQDIVFGRLKPRERLVEEELCARFSVGRHVVRAALDELDRSGLVVRRPNRGVVVRDYSAPEIEHLYHVRRVLQHEAALRIPLPGAPALVQELDSINAEYRRSCRAGDLYRASGLNEQFHVVMFDACENPYLADLIQQFWLKTACIHSRCYAVGNTARILAAADEHDAMIRVLASGTNEALAHLCVEHMGLALTAFKVAAVA